MVFPRLLVHHYDVCHSVKIPRASCFSTSATHSFKSSANKLFEPRTTKKRRRKCKNTFAGKIDNLFGKTARRGWSHATIAWMEWESLAPTKSALKQSRPYEKLYTYVQDAADYGEASITSSRMLSRPDHTYIAALNQR